MRQRPIAALVGVGMVTLGASAYLRAVSPGQHFRPLSAGPPHAVAASFPHVTLQREAPQGGVSGAAERALLDQYCVTCHNQRARTGGLTLDDVDVARVGNNPEVWETVVRKLRGRQMPPPGLPRPAAAAYDGLLSYLETSLDRAAEENPDPGRTEALHRLNRAEYRNAVRDLLALDVDVGAMLPADDVSYGFDNIAGVQRMSPTLMERYIAAAQKISSLAVGASPREPTTDTFLIPPDLRQDHRLEGLPFGTRGGTSLRYHFPRDGEYSVRVQLTRYVGASFDDIPAFDEAQRLELSVDSRPLHVFELSPPDPQGSRGSGPNRRELDTDWQFRFPAKAGPGSVTLTFLNRTPALLENLLEPFQKPVPGGPNGYYTTQKGAYLRVVEITGPFNATGPGDTPSRRRIFVCRPSAGSPASEELACAKEILSTLVRRAFRRPVTDADLASLLALYDEGRNGASGSASFDTGIERAVEGLLVSPEFLFRIERDPATAGSTGVYRISDLELASRLSFFLWSSIPDDALLEAASAGTLRTPGVLVAEVRRMLADPRADALVSNFIGQWLFLRNLPAVSPDPWKDPDFDEDLRRGFRRETELFAASVFREDRSVLDLLTADYTFVNERLARHYGMPNVRGTHFRRVEQRDGNRLGLLGHGSILSVTAFPNRTSPVVRGKWILENLLGSEVPDPPPDVPALEEKPNPADEDLSMRERIARHRANPACASCHAMMDPFGLALENFDFVGRWRTVDEAKIPIDASVTLSDGTPVDGPVGLRNLLAGDPERFARTFTEKLMTYALGRGLEHHDMPAVRKITREAARYDYRTSAIVLGVVNSLPFQMRRRQS
jgi:mono/diheme cytochrome c family protein